MSEARRHDDWTWDAYLEWEAKQPVRHELVDGQVRAMVGGSAEHDSICNNLRAELHNQLRGKPCRPHGPDLKLQAGANARYPDALVDCGARVRNAVLAQRPVAAFEVLSRSTGWIDQTLKLRDYQLVPSIRYYVLISQDEPRALIYIRDDSGRLGAENAVLVEGLAATVELPELDVSLPMATLYDGLEMPAL